jgi:hypothetical protein
MTGSLCGERGREYHVRSARFEYRSDLIRELKSVPRARFVGRAGRIARHPLWAVAIGQPDLKNPAQWCDLNVLEAWGLLRGTTATIMSSVDDLRALRSGTIFRQE